ncbi:hypothetical protein FXO37_17237 [Capsicum annuum]|nr:hypothetical protein FXO37_17237 [Capsicum annuum]
MGLNITIEILGRTQRPFIYPLNIWGESAPAKSKKWMIYSGKSIDEDTDSCWPSTIGVIKELVDGLPTRPREPFTTRHSYVSLSDYEKYIDDQKKKGAIISMLKRAYSALAQSHRELRYSHEKMKNRENKRDKFFAKIWKGLKGLWKVLKPKDKLLSPRDESDDKVPAAWLDSNDVGGGGYDARPRVTIVIYAVTWITFTIFMFF